MGAFRVDFVAAFEGAREDAVVDDSRVVAIVDVVAVAVVAVAIDGHLIDDPIERKTRS